MIFDPQDAVDAPEISAQDAVRHVREVFAGQKKRAFGRNYEDWVEWLADDLVNMQEELVLNLLKDHKSEEEASEAIDAVSAYLRDCVRRHANDWLAEADYDALEREGWV